MDKPYILNVQAIDTNQFYGGDDPPDPDHVITSSLWVLDEQRVPRAESDVGAWQAWMVSNSRIVRQTEMFHVEHQCDVLVSTAFLGYVPEGQTDDPPLLFQTRVFGGGFDDAIEHTATWEAALAAHERMCRSVFGAHPDDIEEDGATSSPLEG